MKNIFIILDYLLIPESPSSENKSKRRSQKCLGKSSSENSLANSLFNSTVAKIVFNKLKQHRADGKRLTKATRNTNE